MDNLIGMDLGRYHILEPLGQGGMATVYKAYDTLLERDVAVKIIRTELFGSAVLEKLLKRFEREAKALARLIHPNIVSVIDYGEHDGKPYLVMPYLPGGTLMSHLGKPIPWQEAARLLLPIARALQYAHEQGVIHRDVKPSNILITPSGEPMLTDFGIAKILDTDESQTLTGTGVGVGTPEYMAPEQWVGKVTAQSDIYSLGVVFYEMVTGHKPYTAETPAALLLKQANDPLPRPVQFVPNLPGGVEKVIFKSLAKQIENRYATIGDFAEALNGALVVVNKTIPVQKPRLKVTSEPSTPERRQGNQIFRTGGDTVISSASPDTINVRPKKLSGKFPRLILIIAGFILGSVAIGLMGSLIFNQHPKSLPKSISPTAERLDAISTMAAQTAFFQLTQLALTQPPTLTPTDTPGLTPSATSALPTGTNPPPVVVSSCANATFVKDVTIPDGTTMTVGQVFTKTWRLTNSGTCPWTTSFKLIFQSGEQMSGQNANLPEPVGVGQTADLSVELTVPNKTGTLTGWWVLVDGTGLRVGKFALSLVINVVAGTATPP